MSTEGPAGLAVGVGVGLGDGATDSLGAADWLAEGGAADVEVSDVLSPEEVHAASSSTADSGRRRRRMRLGYVSPGAGIGTDC